MKRIIDFILLFGLLFNITAAQTSLPNKIKANKISGKIKIDGKLQEKEWLTATTISNFTQRELEEGQPATEKTKVAILFDEKNLYIGVWCFDKEPTKIIANKMKRDFHWGSDDNFEIIIDTYHNNRDGFLFVTNPNGARADVQMTNNGRQMNKSWDAVWDVKTQITNEGWFAEFYIPFSSLKFDLSKSQIWGINFERNISRKHEQLLWQGWSRDSNLENVSRAGELLGLENINSIKMIEVKPFASTGWHKEEKEAKLDAGVDLNYLITPTLKLNLTTNTDFAQVESDRVKINLSRFSIKYPEKREFFLEGSDYFNFGLGRGIQPFYSRKIGLDEDGNEVPILGGVRILGKQGKSTIGGMSIQTAEKDSISSSNYSILRWKQDVGEQSSVGLMSVNKIEPGKINSVIGADFLYSTSSFLKNKNLNIGGAFAQSYKFNSNNTNGNAERLFVSYPSDFVEFDLSWERSSKNFNSTTGYLARTNYQLLQTELQFNPRPTFLPYFKRMVFKPIDIKYYYDDLSGKLESFEAEFRPFGFTSKSGEFFEFNIKRVSENLTEDFEIHENVIIPMGQYWYSTYEIMLSTFRARKISLFTKIEAGDFFQGEKISYSTSMKWNVSKNLNFWYEVQQNRIQLPQANFIVSENAGRIEYAFSPDLFGSLFGQWNNEDQQTILNFRIGWIPKPGTNLYIVVNQVYNTLNENWKTEDTAILSKFIWRFVL